MEDILAQTRQATKVAKPPSGGQAFNPFSLAQTTESACDRDPMSWECSMEYLYGPDGLFSLAQIEAEEYDLAQVSKGWEDINQR